MTCGKVPIYSPDGYYQHYTVLGFAGNTLRGLLHGQLPPMVSFHLGQGLDVVTSLTHHGFFDPLNLLCVFFGEDQIVFAYILIDILRAYLLGVCFVAYAKKIGVRDGWALSLSAIILVFSGYMLFNMARHTYFLNGALYLCLLLLGVETVLRERRWLGYTLTTALMLAVNFYFAFMNTVVAIVYILVRLIARWRAEGVRGTARDGFTLLFGYILGAMLSMVVLLPIVESFLGNARLNETAGYPGSMLHYGFHYYAGMALTLFTANGTAGMWTILNFTPLALFATLGFFWRRDSQARQVQAALILCAIALCFPFVGRFMNGNSYVSNRWSYALGIFIALSCAIALPGLPGDSSPVRRRIIAVAAIIYSAVYMVFWLFLSERNLLMLPGVLLTVAFAVFYGSGRLAKLENNGSRRLLTGFLALSVVVYCAAYWDEADEISELCSKNIVHKYQNETVADRIDRTGFSRIEQPNSSAPHSLLKGYMGTSFYWSLVNERIGTYYQQLGLSTQHALDRVRDLGGSCELNAVAAVRYYILPEGNVVSITPYGFKQSHEQQTADGSVFTIYENDHPLPLGYAYDSAIPEADYQALPVERKLQALLSGAICDSDFIPRTAAPDTAVEVDYEFGPGNGAVAGEGSLKCSARSSIDLKFAAPADSETWLVFEDFSTSGSGAMLGIKSDFGTNYVIQREETDNFYFHRPYTAVCLGSGENGLDGCTLVSRDETVYSWKSLRVVGLPLAEYRKNVEARRSESLQNVQLGDNCLAGTISVGGDRILQIAVPYSKGWRAWVDGQPAEAFPCGGMYMGLALTSGEHEIEMRYTTPGLIPGAILSLAALAAILILEIITRRIRKREANQSSEA